MIEQLWFGWSEVGLEGTNRQQIIAASPGLADIRAPLTRTVLRYCYSPAEPTIGWCEAEGVRIVFRRTPRGLDGRGRPGNYFVHALAAQRNDLAATQLPTVLTGRLLRAEPAADQLPALDRIGADVLTAPPETVEPARGKAALAHYLANLAAGRLTALQAEPRETPWLAAFIARHLPGSLGLVGFSEREVASASTQYDLTSAPAPSPLFADADPSVSAPPGWQHAAELLAEAVAGDPTAADCVQVLAASAASRRDFAVALGHWSALERGEQGAVTEAALRWLDGEPALRQRAMRPPLLDIVIGSALQGEPAAGAVLEHSWTADRMPVIDPVRQALDATTMAAGLDGLMAAGSHGVARAVIEQVAAERAAAGEPNLSTLPLDGQQRLLALFGSHEDVIEPVARLLQNVELASSIVGDPRWPLGWQVHAARAHPARLPASAIIRLLSRCPEQVAALCAPGVPAPLLEQVGHAVAKLELRLAVRVREAAFGGVPDRVDRAWWLSIYQRVDPLTRLAMLVRSGRDGRHGTAAMAAPACAEAVEWCARHGLALPTPGELYQVLSLRDRTQASEALRYACLTINRIDVYRPGLTHLGKAIDAVRDLSGQSLRWAATELLVWRLLEAPQPADFELAMASVRDCLEPIEATAPRLWRAAWVLVRRNSRAALHLVRWTVGALNEATQADGLLQTMDPRQVHALLVNAGLPVEAVAEAWREHARTKDARRWLAAIGPAKKRSLLPWQW